MIVFRVKITSAVLCTTSFKQFLQVKQGLLVFESLCLFLRVFNWSQVSFFYVSSLSHWRHSCFGAVRMCTIIY